MTMTTGHLSQGEVLAEQLASTQVKVTANVERLAEARSRLARTRSHLGTQRAEREIMHDCAYARLLARLDSMPVIEQAKGVIMAQSGCTAEEAFGMLRSASQRTNVRIRDLAGEIVNRASTGRANVRVPR